MQMRKRVRVPSGSPFESPPRFSMVLPLSPVRAGRERPFVSSAGRDRMVSGSIASERGKEDALTFPSPPGAVLHVAREMNWIGERRTNDAGGSER